MATRLVLRVTRSASSATSSPSCATELAGRHPQEDRHDGEQQEPEQQRPSRPRAWRRTVRALTARRIQRREALCDRRARARAMRNDWPLSSVAGCGRQRSLVEDGRLRCRGQRDRPHLARHRLDVRAVDEPGVGLTERDLPDDALDVGLQADGLAQHLEHPEPLEHLARVEPDRDLRPGDDQPQLRVACARSRTVRILRRVRARDDQDEASWTRTARACARARRRRAPACTAGSPRERRRRALPAGSAAPAGSSPRTSSDPRARSAAAPP